MSSEKHGGNSMDEYAEKFGLRLPSEEKSRKPEVRPKDMTEKSAEVYAVIKELFAEAGGRISPHSVTSREVQEGFLLAIIQEKLNLFQKLKDMTNLTIEPATAQRAYVRLMIDGRFDRLWPTVENATGQEPDPETYQRAFVELVTKANVERLGQLKKETGVDISTESIEEGYLHFFEVCLGRVGRILSMDAVKGAVKIERTVDYRTLKVTDEDMTRLKEQLEHLEKFLTVPVPRGVYKKIFDQLLKQHDYEKALRLKNALNINPRFDVETVRGEYATARPEEQKILHKLTGIQPPEASRSASGAAMNLGDLLKKKR